MARQIAFAADSAFRVMATFRDSNRSKKPPLQSCFQNVSEVPFSDIKIYLIGAILHGIQFERIPVW